MPNAKTPTSGDFLAVILQGYGSQTCLKINDLVSNMADVNNIQSSRLFEIPTINQLPMKFSHKNEHTALVKSQCGKLNG